MGPAGTVPNGATWDCVVPVDPNMTNFVQNTGVPFVFAVAPGVQLAGVTIISAFISGVGQVTVRWYDVSGGGSASIPATNYEMAILV
jgi:hypothetical protein